MTSVGLVLTSTLHWWWAEDIVGLLSLLGVVEEAYDTLKKAQGAAGYAHITV